MKAYHVTPQAPTVFCLETMKSFSIFATILMCFDKVISILCQISVAQAVQITLLLTAEWSSGKKEEFMENSD